MGRGHARRLAVFIIVLSSMLSLPHLGMTATQVLYVQPRSANVRESPALDPSNIVGVLPQGTSVTAFEAEGSWYLVQLQDGRTGWMHTSVLGAAKPSASAAGVAASPSPPAPHGPRVHIGVVQDGEGFGTDMYPVFEAEIRELLGEEFAVRFPAESRVVADWTKAGVTAVNA